VQQPGAKLPGKIPLGAAQSSSGVLTCVLSRCLQGRPLCTREARQC
jgi:hypothetical protein